MRRILYAALEAVTCYAEVFQATRTINVTRRKPHLVAFKTVRPLQLLDLTGAWVTRAGASMAISSESRRQARRWSKAFHEAYPTIDGLWYGSAMNGNQPAVALYERAEDALAPGFEVDRSLAHPWLQRAVRGIGLTLGYRVV
ncbi:RES family NAD+ phosphorylase [Pyxidicoccus sp. 3LG]